MNINREAYDKLTHKKFTAKDWKSKFTQILNKSKSGMEN